MITTGNRFMGLKGGRSRQGERGISLIEMLVAVGIIAILATFTVKGAGGMLDRTRSVKCASNLRQISTVLNAYQVDNNGQFPAIKQVGPPQIYWYMALAPYIYTGLKSGTVNGVQTQYGDSRDISPIFRCPAARKDFNAPSEWDVNRSYMATDFMRMRDGTGTKSWEVGVRLSTVASPAKTLVCVDGARTSTTDYSCDSGQTFSSAKISYRHPSGCNGLFFDGHVASLKAEDITQAMWDAP